MTPIESQPERTLRRFEAGDTIKSFNCGDTDLDDFLFNEAPLYAEALLAVTYVYEDATRVLAYFSLANDRVSLGDFNTKTAFNRFRRHRFVNEKRLKSFPAVKICRLAVSADCKGTGIGSDLLDLIKILFVERNKTGCSFITVDAYKAAIPFYLKNGFTFLTEEDNDEHTRLLYFDLSDFLNIKTE